MELPDISREIWENTYCGPEENNIQDSWHRQAKACSDIEKEDIKKQIYNDFLWLLSDFRAAAGGRITANLGITSRQKTTVFNCFTHVPCDLNYKDPDSIEGIYDMLKAQAQTLKSEGGYGTNFSWIRPAGSYIKGIGGRTPGVLKFMELWDKSSEVITIGAEAANKNKDEKKRIRKGAQMGCLCIWHPEIEEFIDAKLVPNRLTKFNLSVGITDGFIDAVLNKSNWDLKFPDTNFENYHEWNGNIKDWEAKGYPVIIHKTVNAYDLWEKIMMAAYTRNEPGVLFLDIANKLNPLYYAEEILTANPCGEIVCATGACAIMSVNVVKHIKKNKDYYEFDFESFKKAVSISIRFIDNVISISSAPLSDYIQAIITKRRIGIGIVSLGSLHYILGIRYGSKESLELINNIFKTKAETELLTSALLGQEKGSFPLFDREKYFNSYWWKNLPIDENIKKKIEEIGEMRNSHHAANAPTGNLSMYVGAVSGGIEPVFEKEYNRWMTVSENNKAILREKGFKFPNISKGEWFETPHMTLSKSGTEDILLGKFEDVEYQVDKNRGLTKKLYIEDYGWKFVKEHFSKEKIEELTNNNVFATTTDLTVDEHINALKTIAKYVNMNSSKTVNIRNDYPYEDFKNLYLDAWKSGIKGITCYRDGTMTSVLEKIDTVHEIARPTIITESLAPKRPNELVCDIHQVTIKGNKWVMLVGLLDKAPYEIFVGASESLSLPSKCTHGKIVKNMKGIYSLYVDVGDEYLVVKNIIKTFDNPENAWATRMISMSLRHGVPIDFIVEQLSKDGNIGDFNKVLSRILKKYIANGTAVKTNTKCPECNSDLVFNEGCLSCSKCIWCKCS